MCSVFFIISITAQDLCRGEYTPFSDYIKSRKTCGNYTLDHLTCIISGIYTIPSEPKNVYVDAINEKSIQVFWQPPDQLPTKVANYVINVTRLHTFDPDALADMSHAELSISVDRSHNSVLVNNLQPLSMYEVSVMATNKFGSSLPSFRVRTLTLDSSISGRRSGGVGADGQLNAVVPKLPGKNNPSSHLAFEFIFTEYSQVIFAHQTIDAGRSQRIKCSICGNANNKLCYLCISRSESFYRHRIAKCMCGIRLWIFYSFCQHFFLAVDYNIFANIFREIFIHLLKTYADDIKYWIIVFVHASVRSSPIPPSISLLQMLSVSSSSRFFILFSIRFFLPCPSSFGEIRIFPSSDREC